jgi:diguanylate cyclase (GGDEF)-like protein
MTKVDELHDALKQLSGDVRVLVDLSLSVSDEAWDRMIEVVKKEVADESGLRRNRSATTGHLLHLALISEIYDHLGLLVKNLKNSQANLRRLATRDLLTGLYNRNFFNEAITRDIKRAERNGEKLSFIVIDIDGFKHINDTFGHLYGDGVLRECASLLRQCARKSDFLCRFGGDEFIIVTPARSCEDNAALFRRIEDSLSAWNAMYSAHDFTLSFSIGCALWEPGRDIVDVLGEADKEMYRNKKKTS